MINLDTNWFDPLEWVPLGLGVIAYAYNAISGSERGMYQSNPTGPTITETVNGAYHLLTWMALPSFLERI